MKDEGSRTKEFLWFLSGSLIGAALGLLLAPQSGQRTRRDIKRMGQDVRRRADRFTEDIQSSLKELVTEIQVATKNAVAAGRDVTAKTKAEILEVIDSGRSFLEDEKRHWETKLRK